MALPIITIGRSFGSGGRIIGKKVATLLNIPIYDRELIALTAKRSGFHETVVEQMQQEHDRFRLMSLGHRFHMTLASMSHNAVLCGFYHSAASQMRSMRVLDTLTLEVYLRGTSDHLLIAQAVVNGDGASAAQAMANHLFKDYAEYLRE